MKKLILLISFYTLYAQGMESHSSVLYQCYEQVSLLASLVWTPIQNIPEIFSHEDMALQAEEYNKHTSFFLLPKEVLHKIIIYCHTYDNDSIKELTLNIKTLMALNATCKLFNALITLDTIGNYCENISSTTTKETLQELISVTKNSKPWLRTNVTIEKMFPKIYTSQVEVNPNKYTAALVQAIYDNDIQLVTMIFNYIANPHVTYQNKPILFYVETIEMANQLINNNVNIHATYYGSNVLDHAVNDIFITSELVELYLAHNVDARRLGYFDGSCLLHRLARQGHVDIKCGNNFLKKAELILNAIPDMINLPNKENRTPMDIAHRSLKRSTSPQTFEKLIKLFRKHGCKAARELEDLFFIEVDEESP